MASRSNFLNCAVLVALALTGCEAVTIIPTGGSAQKPADTTPGDGGSGTADNGTDKPTDPNSGTGKDTDSGKNTGTDPNSPKSGCANPGQAQGVATGTYPAMGLCEDFAGSKLPAWLEPHYFWYPGANTEYESANVSVHDGMLDLKAEPKDCPTGFTTGCDLSHHANYSLAQANTFGLWGTKNPLYGFDYGILQIEVKADPGKGLWTGFWCMSGPTLSDPEIDIEILTNPAGESRMNHMGIHENGYTSHTDTSVNFSDGNFHTLGMERVPKGTKADINFYVDGTLRWSYPGSASVGKIYCAFQNDIDAADFPHWETAPDAATFAKGPVHVYFRNFRYWKK